MGPNLPFWQFSLRCRASFGGLWCSWCGLGRLLSGQSLPAASPRSFSPAGRFWRPPYGFVSNFELGVKFRDFCCRSPYGAARFWPAWSVVTVSLRHLGWDFRSRLRCHASFWLPWRLSASSLWFRACLLGWGLSSSLSSFLLPLALWLWWFCNSLLWSRCCFFRCSFLTPFSSLVFPRAPLLQAPLLLEAKYDFIIISPSWFHLFLLLFVRCIFSGFYCSGVAPQKKVQNRFPQCFGSETPQT